MFLGLMDTDPFVKVKGTNPDPDLFIIKLK
jgi:hypothetical protein